MSREALTAIRADLASILDRLDAELVRVPDELPPTTIDPQLIADLKRDEGLRLSAYPDPLSGGEPWTIGYGHTGPEVHRGLVWTQEDAERGLEADTLAHCRALELALPWVATLDPARRRVLQNMAFNLGVGVAGGARGLLGFKNTLGMIERGDYVGAADGMLRSRWASQVHARADRLAAIMRSGA